MLSLTDASWGLPDWPAKFTALEPVQSRAVDEVIDEFANGADVVFLNAPVGSGKTVISEAVRRKLDTQKTLYVCNTKSLQQQFVNDFPYAKLLKGRSNYPTFDHPELFNDRFQPITAADCAKRKTQLPACGDCNQVSEEPVLHCNSCHPWYRCPYEVAKMDALKAPLAVINTSYFITEANGPSQFSERDFVIVDEFDTLESILRGQIEVNISERSRKRYKLGFPDKKTKEDTWLDWINQEALPTFASAMHKTKAQSTRDEIKEFKYVSGMYDKLVALVKELERSNVVYDGYKNGSIVFKPIRVNKLAKNYLWRHGRRWLCMSGSIIDPQELVDSLGIDEAGLNWSMVTVPNTFPKENRPIVLRSLANMVNGEKETEWPKMAAGVKSVLTKHPDERVLVHTVSYELAQYLFDNLRYSERPVFVYSQASERDNVLEMYKSQEASVLLAPSMDRGIDLPDDACRVMIITKVPYPNMGDKQIKARMYQPGGQLWYTVQTIRTLIQQTGRGVRHKEDRAVTYILDAQFVNNIYKKNKHLLPKYWTEAFDWTGGGL